MHQFNLQLLNDIMNVFKWRRINTNLRITHINDHVMLHTVISL